jgi:O-antigen/teichoic acid export membrane protein
MRQDYVAAAILGLVALILLGAAGLFQYDAVDPHPVAALICYLGTYAAGFAALLHLLRGFFRGGRDGTETKQGSG